MNSKINCVNCNSRKATHKLTLQEYVLPCFCNVLNCETCKPLLNPNNVLESNLLIIRHKRTCNQFVELCQCGHYLRYNFLFEKMKHVNGGKLASYAFRRKQCRPPDAQVAIYFFGCQECIMKDNIRQYFRGYCKDGFTLKEENV